MTAVGLTAGGAARYKYDASGARYEKAYKGVTTSYHLIDGVAYGEKRSDGVELQYLYDENGRVYGLRKGGILYYFLFNGQGDVIGIVDEYATLQCRYAYDAWGKVLSVKDASGAAITNATHIGNLNPFRYRGYYYDVETGFYYLNSRYYDPTVKRFLNGDVYLHTGNVLGLNAFAYCYNNPIMYADYTGCIPEWLWGLGAGAAAVDGPLPFGDIILGGIVVVGLITSLAALPDINTAPISRNNITDIRPYQEERNNSKKNLPDLIPIPDNKKTSSDDVVVYRWGRNRNDDPREFQNLTPRPSDHDGISFSLVPDTSKRNTKTTLSALKAAGFQCTVSGKHVSVMPLGGTLELKSWQATYHTANANPHALTLLLYSITT